MTQPQPGDFGLVPMGGDAGSLIRLGQWLNGSGFADYEHAFVYVGDDLITEAEPGGARCVTQHYDGVLWSTGIIPLTGGERMDIVKAARGYAAVRTPYSAVDYFALAARRLRLGLLAPGLKTYVASSKHMICSQLADQCYADAGVHLFSDGRWPGYVTPGDLYQLLHRASTRPEVIR